ncbi:MAG: hypothetical protein ACYCVV_18260 [Acidimicrobiales bacterium]
MSAWVAPVTCPRCGGELALEAAGVPRCDGREVQSIVYCQECRQRSRLVVVLVAEVPDRVPNETRRTVAECGTDGGYYHHKRIEGEDACPACRAAHTAAESARVAKHRKVGVFS